MSAFRRRPKAPAELSHIGRVFARCREEGRAAFIPYITAGDPDLETTARLIPALAQGGADLVELGVPFSDPIADGPVNQRAAARALASGTSLAAILGMVATVRTEVETPIVLFTYFNPIHAVGIERFAEQAAASGVDGVLCVDLPPEEAEREYVPAMRAQGVDTTFLLAPTSGKERIRRVEEASSGFVYYVSRTGVTGARTTLPADLLKQIRRTRRKLSLPLAVGFGIRTPEQVAELGKVADGVVVGSALVRMVEEASPGADLAGILTAEVRRLSGPLRPSPESGEASR